MSGSNRSSLIAKMYKVLKQHYKPMTSNGDRPLLEQMLFACCLENAPHDKAEKTFVHLSTSFFDWNEVRVSTVKELSEAMRDLPDPTAAASNLKRILQTVFEATYSFELEAVKKQNIGVGIKRLAKMEGVSPFVVAYATQHALGGHFIPLDRGALEVLYIVGIATDAERQSASVAGLERAIPKSKGAEFGSLLHQLSAEFVANPHAPAMKSLLLSINPEGKDRFPKRGQKILAPRVEPSAPSKPGGKNLLEKNDGKATKTALDKPSRDGQRPPEKLAGKKDETKDSRKSAGVKAPHAADAKSKPPLKKPLPVRPAAKSNRPRSIAVSGAGRSSGHKSPTKQLVKRKPR